MVRSEAPPARSAKASNPRFPTDFKLWTRTFRPVGPAWTAASSVWEGRPLLKFSQFAVGMCNCSTL
eukprot:15449673-Alexandrium_andersonii.AAC.1